MDNTTLITVMVAVFAGAILIFIWRFTRQIKNTVSEHSSRLDKITTAPDWHQSQQLTAPILEMSDPELTSILTDSSAIQTSIPNETRDTEVEPTNLICLSILAKENAAFVGYELLQSLLSNGLRFGEMSIFHRYVKENGNEKILFSLACATEPGIFDMNKIGVTSCRGLTLFMRLDGAEHNLDALEQLLDTANLLAEDLHGYVVDETHQPLSKEKISAYQEIIKNHQSFRIRNGRS